MEGDAEMVLIEALVGEAAGDFSARPQRLVGRGRLAGAEAEEEADGRNGGG